MWPSLTRMTGCHAGDRPSSQSSRKSGPPPLRSRRGTGPSDRDLDLLRLNGQGHSSIGPYFQAGRNRFANILDRFAAGLTLRHAAGNARAFRDPHAVFVLRQRDEELHGAKVISSRIWRQKAGPRAAGGVPHQAHEGPALVLRGDPEKKRRNPTPGVGAWSDSATAAPPANASGAAVLLASSTLVSDRRRLAREHQARDVDGGRSPLTERLRRRRA
jgi:hypothetical protein